MIPLDPTRRQGRHFTTDEEELPLTTAQAVPLTGPCSVGSVTLAGQRVQETAGN
jgi:hypothetical protein